MADGKRGGAAGKVATPRVKPTSDMAEMDGALWKAIGARIKVTVAPHNISYEGTLFTACPITNLIAINTAPAIAGLGNYHIIPVSHLLNFQIVSEAPRVEGAAAGFEGVLPPIGRVDLDALRNREEVAVRKLREQEANRGKGVTKEAQEVFDFVRRTLPAYWHKTSIIVNEAVRIDEPYRSENCIAPKDKEKSLVQVRKIVDAYHARKKATGSIATPPMPANTPQGRPLAATPNVPRKGG